MIWRQVHVVTMKNEAINVLYAGAFELRVVLGDIGLHLEPTKTHALSNSPSALKRVRRLFGIPTGADSTVVRLGVDHSCANPTALGRNPKAKQRIKKH